MTPLPRAAEPFVAFGALLRANGFAIAPEQTVAFLDGVRLLGPRGISDIAQAALATFAVPPERRDDFDALFAFHFLGQGGLVEEARPTDEEVKAQDDRGAADIPLSDEVNEAGEAATSAEALSVRRFAPADPDAALRRLVREAPARLPRRRGRRLARSRRGRVIDLRRTLRESVRHDGEAMRLPRLKRRERQRGVLVLADVSGSMKERSEAHLKFAHALARACDRIEVFTFGTRLTRVTRAVRLRHQAQALDAAAALVPDFDGGTRIGDALQAFLAVPRFAGYARGAVTLILSDGLERGAPDAMVEAVRRLSRRSWALVWATPLAADPAYRPQTEALSRALPHIDRLADGGSTESLVKTVLSLSGRAA